MKERLQKYWLRFCEWFNALCRRLFRRKPVLTVQQAHEVLARVCVLYSVRANVIENECVIEIFRMKGSHELYRNRFRGYNFVDAVLEVLKDFPEERNP